MIHLYHGLFGSSADWQQIFSPEDLCVRHDLYRERIEALLELRTNPQDVLLGYSMGGRLVLEIAARNLFRLQKIILVSTHPGLLPQQRGARRDWEADILSKMRTLSPSDFESFWNSQALFKASRAPALSERSLRESADLFGSFRLSDQAHRDALLAQNHSKIVWVTGELDQKYQELARNRIRPLGIRTYETNSDHRALSDAQGMRTILQKEGVL